MASLGRTAALGGCFAAALFCLGPLAGGAEPAAPTAAPGAAVLPPLKAPGQLGSVSARGCVVCHEGLVRQWRQSMHSAAYVDPEYQETWRQLGRPAACLPCHLPLSQARPQLPDGSANPDYEPLLGDEGVGCAACHVRDGFVLTPRKQPSKAAREAHPVRTQTALESAQFCAECHQSSEPGKAIYNTYREWAESPQGKRGMSCQDCHLEPRPAIGADGQLLRQSNHKIVGAHSDPQLDRALFVDVRLNQPTFGDGDTVQARVTVTNRGAGHFVPSGSPFHRIRLTVGIADENGQFLSSETRWFGRSVRSFVPFAEGDDTRIAPGETVEQTYRALFTAATGDERYLTVQLTYFLLPPDLATELGIPEEIVARTFATHVVPLNR